MKTTPPGIPGRGFSLDAVADATREDFWRLQKILLLKAFKRSEAALPCRRSKSCVQAEINALQKVTRKAKTTAKAVVFVVDDTRLELVTSRTSSGCATSCANRPGGDKRDRTADLLNAIRLKTTKTRASPAFWMQCGCNRFATLSKLLRKWGAQIWSMICRRSSTGASW